MAMVRLLVEEEMTQTIITKRKEYHMHFEDNVKALLAGRLIEESELKPLMFPGFDVWELYSVSRRKKIYSSNPSPPPPRNILYKDKVLYKLHDKTVKVKAIKRG